MKRIFIVTIIAALAFTLPMASSKADEELWDFLFEAARALDTLNRMDNNKTTTSTPTYTNYCDSINWPNTEGECGIEAFHIKGSIHGSIFDSNTHYTPRAKGYITRVFTNGNYEFRINYLYPLGKNIKGYRVGGVISVSFLYPCVSEKEIEKIYNKCVPH